MVYGDEQNKARSAGRILFKKIFDDVFSGYKDDPENRNREPNKFSSMTSILFQS